MPRVKLMAVQGHFSGTAIYDHSCHNLFSECKEPYDLDRWFYDIKNFGITCDEDKQIIEVGGYEPCRNWIYNPSIAVPEPRACCNFVIDEPFDPMMRLAGEQTDLRVEVSPEQAVVRVSLVGVVEKDVDKVFVSPHDNLLVGATDADPMILTEFILLNVAGVDQL